MRQHREELVFQLRRVFRFGARGALTRQRGAPLLIDPIEHEARPPDDDPEHDGQRCRGEGGFEPRIVITGALADKPEITEKKREHKGGNDHPAREDPARALARQRANRPDIEPRGDNADAQYQKRGRRVHRDARDPREPIKLLCAVGVADERNDRQNGCAGRNHLRPRDAARPRSVKQYQRDRLQEEAQRCVGPYPVGARRCRGTGGFDEKKLIDAKIPPHQVLAERGRAKESHERCARDANAPAMP